MKRFNIMVPWILTIVLAICLSISIMYPIKQTSSTTMQFDKPTYTKKSDKRVFLNASPNKNGNTEKMARSLIGNSNFEQIDLANYNIPQEGKGVGDFPKVYSKLKSAKVIVIGTPVYWSNMSGYLKTFIDRMQINDDLKGKDLYVIVQGSDTNQSVARASTYGSLKRISIKFGLNFIGIASNDAEISQLNKKLNP